MGAGDGRSEGRLVTTAGGHNTALYSTDQLVVVVTPLHCTLFYLSVLDFSHTTLFKYTQLYCAVALPQAAVAFPTFLR